MSTILDDPKKIAEIDKGNIRRIMEQFPEQCEDAIKTSQTLKIPQTVKINNKLIINYKKPQNIIVTGLGGSAIGGNLLKDWSKDTLPIPIEICRSYHLPAYANQNTLVLALSYSGNTEETLSTYLEAIERQCMTITLTSGGTLAKFNEELSLPLLKLPTTYPQPRSAIAHLFFPLITTLEKLNLIPPAKEEEKEAVTILKKLQQEVRSETPTASNPAKKLALSIKGGFPFICGFNIYESVALRIKTQFNENSKITAKSENFSEMNHNETVGWTGPDNLTKNFSVILIRDEQEPPEIKTRIEVTRNMILDKNAKNIQEIHARGKGKLARMLSTMYIGDFSSVYLAFLYEVDPLPIPIIDALKKQLEERVNKPKELKERFEKLKNN